MAEPNPYLTPSLVQFNGSFMNVLTFPNIFYKNNPSVVANKEHVPRDYNLKKDMKYGKICQEIQMSKNEAICQKILNMLVESEEEGQTFNLELNSRGANTNRGKFEENSENSTFFNSFVSVAQNKKIDFSYDEDVGRVDRMDTSDDDGQPLSPLQSLSQILTTPTPQRTHTNLEIQALFTQPFRQPTFFSPRPKGHKKPPPLVAADVEMADEGEEEQEITEAEPNSYITPHKMTRGNFRKLSTILTPVEEDLDVKKFQESVNNLFIFDSQNVSKDLISYDRIKGFHIDVLIAKKKEIINRVKEDELIHVVRILNGELSKCEYIFTNSDDEKLVESVVENGTATKTGLIICQSVLELMSTTGLSRLILIEEVIENVINYMKYVTRDYFYPQTEQKDNAKKPTRGKKREKFDFIAGEKFDDEFYKEEEDISAETLYDRVNVLLTALMNLLFKFTKLNPLKDEFIFDIIDMSVKSFFVIGDVHSIQFHAMNILSYYFATQINKREQIIKSIAINILKLPQKKRVKQGKTYYIKEENIYIYTFSALVMKLIQSCAGTGDFFSDEEDVKSKTGDYNSGDEEDTPTPVLNKFVSPFEDKLLFIPKGKMSVEIMGANYERAMSCAKLFVDVLLERCKEQTVDGDPRMIIDNFVGDLLATVTVPTCPSADLLLKVFTQSVITKYVENPKVGDKMRSKGVDVLGQIAAKCLELVKDFDHPSKEIGVLFKEMQENGSTAGFYQNFADIKMDRNDMHRLLIHNYLASQNQEGTNAYDLQFSICQWYFKDEHKDQKQALYRTMWTRQTQNFVQSITYEDVKICNFRVLNSYRSNNYNMLVNKIFKQVFILTKENRVKIRQQAIRAMQMCVHIKPLLMNQKHFQSVIIERSKDEKIKVRESVVDLVGKFVEENPKIDPVIFQNYLEMITERLKDPGKNCRKKVIRILGVLFAKKPNLTEKQRTYICLKLSELLNEKEEENIQKLVLSALEKMWFDERDYKKKGNQQVIFGKMIQILSVVSRKAMSIRKVGVEIRNYWFTNLLRNNEKRVKVFEKIVEQLVNHIIALDTRFSSNVEQKELTKDGEIVVKTPPKMPRDGRHSLNSCFSLLYIFAYSNESVLNNSIKNLIQLLTLDSVIFTHDQNEALFFLTEIIILVLPQLPNQTTAFNNSLLRNLVTLIGKADIAKMNWDVFASVVRCFCMFVQKIRMYTLLVNVLNKLFSLIRSKPNSRAVRTLGLICQYYDFKNSPKLANLGKGLENGKIKKNVFTQLIAIYSAKGTSEELRSDIIEALGSMFIKYPKLFLNKDFSSILNSALGEGGNEMLKLAVVNLIVKYLVNEEVKISTKQDVEDDEDISNASESEKTEVSIGMSIVPKFIKKFLEFLSSPNEELRRLTVELLGLTIRQGLYVPGVIAPFVIAMEGDISERVSQIAHMINIGFQEKLPNDFLSKFAEGVKLGFNLMHKNKLFNVNRGLRMVYDNIISKKCRRREKNMIFDQLLKSLYDFNDVQYFSYLLQAFFKSITLTTKEDACHIIYKIDFLIDKDTSNVKSVKVKDDDEKSWVDTLRLICLINLKIYIMNAYNINYTEMGIYNDSSPAVNFKKGLVKHFVQKRHDDFGKEIELFRNKKFDELYKSFKNFYSLHVNNSCKLSQLKVQKRGRKRKREVATEDGDKEEETGELDKKKRKKQSPAKKTRGRKKKVKVGEDDDYVPGGGGMKRKHEGNHYEHDEEEEDEYQPPPRSRRKRGQ